jgi:predicted RNA-binding protein with PIN domain
MADPTLYLFDGYNLLHAGPFSDRRGLVDALASFVAETGARGVVVFDGAGDDAEIGRLKVRFAPDADALLERLAAEHRSRERVLLVSSDATVLGTAGRQVANLSSQTFFRDLGPSRVPEAPPGGLADKLDEETRAKLERLRRGES